MQNKHTSYIIGGLFFIMAFFSHGSLHAQVITIDAITNSNIVKSTIEKGRSIAATASNVIATNETLASIGSTVGSVQSYIADAQEKLEEYKLKYEEYKARVEEIKAKAQEYKELVESKIDEAKELKDKVEQGIEDAKQTAEGLKDAAKSKLDEAKETVEGIKDAAKSKLDDVKEKVDGVKEKAGLSGSNSDNEGGTSSTDSTGGSSTGNSGGTGSGGTTGGSASDGSGINGTNLGSEGTASPTQTSSRQPFTTGGNTDNGDESGGDTGSTGGDTTQTTGITGVGSSSGGGSGSTTGTTGGGSSSGSSSGSTTGTAGVGGALIDGETLNINSPRGNDATGVARATTKSVGGGISSGVRTSNSNKQASDVIELSEDPIYGVSTGRIEPELYYQENSSVPANNAVTGLENIKEGTPPTNRSRGSTGRRSFTVPTEIEGIIIENNGSKTTPSLLKEEVDTKIEKINMSSKISNTETLSFAQIGPSLGKTGSLPNNTFIFCDELAAFCDIDAEEVLKDKKLLEKCITGVNVMAASTDAETQKIGEKILNNCEKQYHAALIAKTMFEVNNENNKAQEIDSVNSSDQKDDLAKVNNLLEEMARNLNTLDIITTMRAAADNYKIFQEANFWLVYREGEEETEEPSETEEPTAKES